MGFIIPRAESRGVNISESYSSKNTLTFHHTHKLHGILKTKSSAVFMLRSGTGAFIQHQGHDWVMTNNHVVGMSNCSTEGCWARAVLHYERGRQPRYLLLRLRPRAARDDIDVSLFSYEAWNERGQKINFRPPATLNLASLKLTTPKGLNPGSKNNGDIAITVIGHPRTGLKKFSRGHIQRERYGHIMVSALTLPGSSGSPILNAHGDIVGIHHSSSKRNDMWTEQGLLYQGRGSSLSALHQVFDSAHHNTVTRTRPRGFISTKHPISLADAKKHSAVYQSSGVIPQLLSGGDFFKELYHSCQTNLNRITPHPSLNAFKSAHQSCSIARRWLHCPNETSSLIHLQKQIKPKSDKKSLHVVVDARTPSPQFTHYYCPKSTTQRHQWNELSGKIAKGYEDFTGADPLKWGFDARLNLATGPRGLISYFPKDLPTSHHERLGLVVHLNSTHPKNLLRVARLFRRFPELASSPLALVLEKTKHTLEHYQQIPDYPFHLPALAQTVVTLATSSQLSTSDAGSILTNMLQDSQTSLWARLAIERYHYQLRHRLRQELGKNPASQPVTRRSRGAQLARS